MFLKYLAFRHSAASPCVSMHAEKVIATGVHGNVFTSAAPKCKLDWLESKLRAKCELREGPPRAGA